MAARSLRVLLTLGCVALSNAAALQAQRKAGHFIKQLRYNQEFRICNAYPFGSALGIKIGKKMMTDTPIAYKTCGTFKPRLREGDRVNFLLEDETVGTFTISELPTSDAVLLMVIYRHDTYTSSVSFESHVFSNQELAQIAVLDTYKGPEESELRIKAPPPPPPPPAPKKKTSGAADAVLVQTNQTNTRSQEEESELLRYDNVVAVDPGLYEVEMRDSTGEKLLEKRELVALGREAYVVVRCGVETQGEGESYPQEFMIYPQSNKADLPQPPKPKVQSGALGHRAWLGYALLAFAAMPLAA